MSRRLLLQAIAGCSFLESETMFNARIPPQFATSKLCLDSSAAAPCHRPLFLEENVFLNPSNLRIYTVMHPPKVSVCLPYFPFYRRIHGLPRRAANYRRVYVYDDCTQIYLYLGNWYYRYFASKSTLSQYSTNRVHKCLMVTKTGSNIVGTRKKMFQNIRNAVTFASMPQILSNSNGRNVLDHRLVKTCRAKRR